VADKALSVLHGEATAVAASIRRKATCLDLAADKAKRGHLRRLPAGQEGLPLLRPGARARVPVEGQ